MKKILIAFLVMLIAGSCYAASIDVPESLPEKSVWSFSVTLPNGQDFDDADVFLDGDRLISFYTNPQDEIVTYDVDESRLFSSTDPIGNRVYFLVSPLSEGNHRIKLEVDDSVEAEEEVEFFEIYDSDSGSSLQDQINSVKTSVGSMIEQYNAMESKISAALTEEDKQALQSSINNVSSSVSALESKLEEQAEQSDTKDNALLNDIESVKSEIVEMKEPQGLGAAFASLPEVSPEAQMGAIGLIIAIGAAALFIKFKDKLPLNSGLYGGSDKEENSFSKQDEDIAEQVMNEETGDSGQTGKWAFGSGGSRPVKEERKRFNIGDLIKK